jgi:hypothetical protein
MDRESSNKEGKTEFREKLEARKMDEENLILETSEDLEIFPTFDSMSLKEQLVRGKHH